MKRLTFADDAQNSYYRRYVAALEFSISRSGRISSARGTGHELIYITGASESENCVVFNITAGERERQTGAAGMGDFSIFRISPWSEGLRRRAAE